MKNNRYSRRLAAIFASVSILVLVACTPAAIDQAGSTAGTRLASQTPAGVMDSASLADLCSTPPDEWLSVESASSAPALGVIEAGTPSTMGIIGREGAIALAGSIRPRDTFCSLGVSDSARGIINQALQLVSRNQKSEARRMLENLLNQASAPYLSSKAVPISLVFGKPQSSLGDRQRIRDLVNAGGADILAGGDGQAFQDAASHAFNDLANSELPDADFGESMRLTEEALQLGEQEIADAASQRAKDIWEENLDAAIEDFDPCTATKQEVTDLLNKLAQGMLLGLEGTGGTGGSRYDAVDAKFKTAVKRMYNDAARKARLYELVEPLPECEKQAELEIEYIFAAAVVGMEPNTSVTIPLNINWGLTPSPVSGNGQLVYNSTTTDADCSFIGQGSWAVQVDGQVDSPEQPAQVQLQVVPSGSPMTFDITCSSGSRGGTDLEPNSSTFTLPWQDGASVQSGFLWTFTLHLH